MRTWKRTALACVSLFVVGLAPIGAANAQVKVTAANPSSAYQGTIALDVVVSGSGFNNSAQVQFLMAGTTNPGGITVKKVTFRKSTELVTTIDVADTADLASFDIIVTLSDGRKGKGTTLFSVKAKPTGPAPAPAYPPGRFYHGIASNGGTTTQSSRLYMFGGAADGATDLGDLWAYSNAGSTNAQWTLIPGGTLTPSVRHLMGWSCGGGRCLMVNGWRGASWVKETWVFKEATQDWSQVNCGRRVICPSERAATTMAYDASNGSHLLFGGEATGSALLNDTFLFDSTTSSWRQVSGGATPPAREAAAGVFVPGVGVVMFGGWGNPCCITTLNDMHVWNGSSWAPVASLVNSDPPRQVPTIALASMAWDANRNVMIVTGGFLTTWHTPNQETWYVTIAWSNGAWRSTWSLATGVGCQAAASSPPDPIVHVGARMAFDLAGRVQVFFGGETEGALSYANTVECR